LGSAKKKLEELAFRLRIGESVALRELLNLFHAGVQKFSQGVSFGIGITFQPFISRFKFLEADNQKMLHAKAPGVELCNRRFTAGLGAAKISLNRLCRVWQFHLIFHHMP
jgi:hypothetical protein